jgi:hypothetical protein
MERGKRSLLKEIAIKEAEELRIRIEIENKRIENELISKRKRENINYLLNSIQKLNNDIDNRDVSYFCEYDIVPDINKFPLVAPNEEDFDIPMEWKVLPRVNNNSFRRRSDLKYESYRTIIQNVYRYPLQRPYISRDESIQLCMCTNINGCDSSCQNRLLYMECPPGCCQSISDNIENIAIYKNNRITTSITNNEEIYNNNSDINSEDNSDNEIDNENNNNNNNLDYFINEVNINNIKYCKNTIIQTKSFPKSEIFSDGDKGCGLRVLQNIQANTILLEYLGEVITSSDCIERMCLYSQSDAFYFASLGNGLMLDAKSMGSKARFANHSCDPTCELQKWTVLGEPRIVLVSKDSLLAGAEITYNYQYYDDGLDNINGKMSLKRQICLCGSSNCSGTIGGKVQVSDCDIWKNKAKSLLIKKNTIENLQLHISNDILFQNNVDDNCFEVQEIKDLINEGEEYENIVSRFLNNEENIEIIDEEIENKDIKPNKKQKISCINIINKSIDISEAQKIIDESPQSIKLNSITKLEQLIKRANKTNRFNIKIDDDDINNKDNIQIENIKDNQLEILTNSSSSLSSSIIKPFIHPSINILKSILLKEKCLKLTTQHLVKSVDWDELVDMIKEVASIIPLRCNKLYELLGLYQECSNYCRYWINNFIPKSFNIDLKIDKISYESIQDLNNLYGLNLFITNDLFSSTLFLEDRLSTYMIRLKDLNDNNLLINETKDNNNSICKRHCFCNCTEEDSELEKGVMSQCDQCDNWYHLICSNSTNSQVNLKIKRNKFICTICLHKSNIMNNFSYLLSNNDWEMFNDKVGISVKKNNFITTPRKSSNFNIEDLEIAIEEEKNIFISNNPCSLLLKLCYKYVLEWKNKVDLYLDIDYIKLILFDLDNNSNINNIEEIDENPLNEFEYLRNIITLEELERESEIIDNCLKLYFEIRILKVKTILHTKLRKIVWFFSTKTIVQCINNNDNGIKRYTLKDIHNSIKCGRYLNCCNCYLFKYILKLYNYGYRLILIASKCEIIDMNLDLILELLNKFNNVIDISKEYPFIRLQSLIFSIKRYSVISKLSNEINIKDEIIIEDSDNGLSKINHDNNFKNNDSDNNNSIDDNNCVSSVDDLGSTTTIINDNINNDNNNYDNIYDNNNNNDNSNNNNNDNNNSNNNNDNNSDNNYNNNYDNNNNINIDNNSDHELYCICDSKEFGDMLMCDQCLGWFHLHCIGISNKNKIPDIFTCIGCSEKNKTKYLFEWDCNILINENNKNNDNKKKRNIVKVEKKEEYKNIKLNEDKVVKEI